MITSARIKELRELGGCDWIGALKASQIAALARDDGLCRCRCSTSRTSQSSLTRTTQQNA